MQEAILGLLQDGFNEVIIANFSDISSAIISESNDHSLASNYQMGLKDILFCPRWFEESTFIFSEYQFPGMYLMK